MIDNSHLCFECTGAGCKVCNGTGIDPNYKGTPAPELLEEATKQTCRNCSAEFMAATYKIYMRKKDGLLYAYRYKSVLCWTCRDKFRKYDLDGSLKNLKP